MTRWTTVLLVGGLLVAPARAEAGPEVAGPEGRLCAVTGTYLGRVDDVSLSVGHYVDGGPALGEPGGRLICTIQAGSTTHNGPDHQVVHGEPAGSDGVLIVRPEPVVPYAGDGYLCTSYRTAGGSYLYRHPGDGPGESGRWTTDPTKPCEHLPIP